MAANQSNPSPMAMVYLDPRPVTGSTGWPESKYACTIAYTPRERALLSPLSQSKMYLLTMLYLDYDSYKDPDYINISVNVVSPPWT